MPHTITLRWALIWCIPPCQDNLDSSSSLEIKISADAFCDGQRAMVIDGVIFIKNYTTYKTYTRNSDLPGQRGFYWGDDVYYLLSFDQYKSLRVYGMNIVSFRTRQDSQGVYTQPRFATAVTIPEASAGTLYQNNPMGFDVQTQTHVMRMKVTSNLVEDANGNGVLRQQDLQGDSGIGAQLIFTVDYETATAGRRRRRQSSTAQDRSQGQAAVSADISFITPLGQETASAASAAAASSTWLVLAMSLLAILA